MGPDGCPQCRPKPQAYGRWELFFGTPGRLERYLRQARVAARRPGPKARTKSKHPLACPMAVALVTGAARGIGQATALRLARDGFDLVLHHNQSDIEPTKRAIQELGRDVRVVQADLADMGQARRCAQQAGPVDVFVANAGVYHRNSLATTNEAAWNNSMAVNLDAPAAMVQTLLPNLAADARIVFVSSIAAERGSRHGAAYAAGKAGLVGLTRSLARELAPRTVNCVSPGYIATDMIGEDSDEKRAKRSREVPLGRIGEPADAADVIAWLCSPGAAYTTGSTIRVNGGLR